MQSETERDRRYEVKMVAHGLLLPLVKSWVRTHPAGFVTSYPNRRVNNVYFDTPDLQLLQLNLAGISERRKVRFRWYGDGISQVEGTVEVKRKQNRRSWKVTYPVNRRFDFQDGKPWSVFVDTLAAELPVWMKAEMGSAWWPILVNRYTREYYATPDGKIRVTVDYAQQVYDQSRSVCPDLQRLCPSLDTVIVETKASESSWERVKEVCNKFPLTVTRNSKYLVGCEAIFNH